MAIVIMYTCENCGCQVRYYEDLINGECVRCNEEIGDSEVLDYSDADPGL